jgi:hypothetical protein
MIFLNCPACLDREGTVRCGLPAEVRCRFTMRSTEAAPATTPLPTIWELAWAYHGTNDGPRTPASARDTMWLAWAAHDQWPWGGQ